MLILTRTVSTQSGAGSIEHIQFEPGPFNLYVKHMCRYNDQSNGVKSTS
jgi:hypothetical protein